MATSQIPVKWLEKLFVCNACGNTSLKSWAKDGAQGILCMRCHPYVEGYLTLPRIGEIK
jgi:hypothetical protein